jgi:hypothetical protein
MNTMKNDLATPRPWTLEHKEFMGCGFNVWKIFDEYGEREIAVSTLVDDAEQKANAELIVRAVNNLDALIEVCRAAEKSLSLDASGASPAFIAEMQHVRICLRNAVANAEK